MPKQDLDKKVLKLMENVKERRARVGSLQRPSWKTSCSLELPGWERLNIQVCMDLGVLAHAAGTLRRMEDDFVIAAKELEIGIAPKWQNYPIEDWITDIKLRCRVTQIKAEQKKLADMETKLKGLVSEEQRREMALADIEKELEE